MTLTDAAARYPQAEKEQAHDASADELRAMAMCEVLPF